MSALGCSQALSPKRAARSAQGGPMIAVSAEEVGRFDRLAATCWDRSRPMRPPHGVNKLRLGPALEQITRRFGRPLASTINRTLRSCLAAIVGAERVFRVLPRGTQRWAQYVRPEELEQAAAPCGVSLIERHGMA